MAHGLYRMATINYLYAGMHFQRCQQVLNIKFSFLRVEMTITIFFSFFPFFWHLVNSDE